LYITYTADFEDDAKDNGNTSALTEEESVRAMML